jgi:uncharacterized protein (TIGR00251 family)
MQSNIPKSIYKKLDKVVMVVKAKPGSKKEGINGNRNFMPEICEEYVGVNIKAPPVDGQANKAIVRYLAEIFGLSKADVCLEKGSCNKNKIISLSDITEEEVLECLKNNLL